LSYFLFLYLRNIGPAIGKTVAQLFYTNGPLN